MMNQPGFMIYADDWSNYISDYSTEEIGEMLKALLCYFSTGEVTEFEDRGMRQFYRQAVKSIVLDRIRYEDKCLKNAYNRYRGTFKNKDKQPLDFDDWYSDVYMKNQGTLTNVNRRQGTSTDVTNTNTNNQLPTPIINSQSSEISFERESRGETLNDREAAFDRRRTEAIEAITNGKGLQRIGDMSYFTTGQYA